LSERIPLPPCPDGAFSIGGSDDLDVGEVRPIHYLGRNRVLWRGEDGDGPIALLRRWGDQFYSAPSLPA